MDIPPGMEPAEALYELGLSRKDAQAFVDWHAHYLAERQRAWLRFQGYTTDCVCGSCSWCLVQDPIDLIDPIHLRT